MSHELLARAEALKARNRLLVTVPGSGYHDDDRNPTRPHLFAAQQHYGLKPVSENLVVFFGEYDVTFVGDDAHAALAALRGWYDQNEIRDPWEMQGTEMKMLRHVPRLAIADAGGVPVLTLRRELWNDYLWVLEKMKISLTGNPETPQEA